MSVSDSVAERERQRRSVQCESTGEENGERRNEQPSTLYREVNLLSLMCYIVWAQCHIKRNRVEQGIILK